MTNPDPRATQLEHDLRRAINRLTSAAEEAEEQISDIRDLFEEVDSTETHERQLLRAVHALHEQAHGLTPLRTCMQDPCRDIRHYVTELPTGPALPIGR